METGERQITGFDAFFDGYETFEMRTEEYLLISETRILRFTEYTYPGVSPDVYTGLEIEKESLGWPNAPEHLKSREQAVVYHSKYWERVYNLPVWITDFINRNRQFCGLETPSSNVE